MREANAKASSKFEFFILHNVTQYNLHLSHDLHYTICSTLHSYKMFLSESDHPDQD